MQQRRNENSLMRAILIGEAKPFSFPWQSSSYCRTGMIVILLIGLHSAAKAMERSCEAG
jgi:hypothetical protein